MGDSGKFLLEKTIVDSDGRVVLAIDEKSAADANCSGGNVDKKRASYKNMALFRSIKSRRNGTIIRAENGRYMAYIFSGMYSVEWYYIEKIDLEELLREHGVEVPVGMNPGA